MSLTWHRDIILAREADRNYFLDLNARAVKEVVMFGI